MKNYLVMGLFAFFVMIVSLARIMRQEEFFRLVAMKRIWGRSRGLLMHFLANVALPSILGIVFLTQGIVGVADRKGGGPGQSTRAGIVTNLNSSEKPAGWTRAKTEGATRQDGDQDWRVGVLPQDLHWFRVP